MTPAQASTLKAFALADQTASALMADGNDMALAEWFTTTEAAYIVWKSDLRPDTVPQVFVWTEIDALTNGKARIWEWMRLMLTLDCRIANIRKGLNDAFTGATATKAAVLAFIKRSATHAEKACASGVGSDASPAILDFVGSVSSNDCITIRNAT